jgi:hypothetical protein
MSLECTFSNGLFTYVQTFREGLTKKKEANGMGGRQTLGALALTGRKFFCLQDGKQAIDVIQLHMPSRHLSSFFSRYSQLWEFFFAKN